MFRTRPRPENPARPTAARGSIGSARVWDERTRQQHKEPPAVAATEPGAAPQPAVGAQELAALVRGIVQVTLDTRLADCEPVRRQTLAHELEARLLALFSAPPPPVTPATTVPDRAAPEQAPHEPLEAPAPTTPAERALGLLLEERLSRLGGPLSARADLRARLITLALAALEPASEPEASGASGEELRNLDVLQRRLSKLERSLQDARAALAYVSGLERVETGLASIYRVVQGLAQDDPQRKRKHKALERLFQANLALQQKAAPDAS